MYHWRWPFRCTERRGRGGCYGFEGEQMGSNGYSKNCRSSGIPSQREKQVTYVVFDVSLLQIWVTVKVVF